MHNSFVDIIKELKNYHTKKVEFPINSVMLTGSSMVCWDASTIVFFKTEEFRCNVMLDTRWTSVAHMRLVVNTTQTVKFIAVKHGGVSVMMSAFFKATGF